jgi:hypothetical protein
MTQGELDWDAVAQRLDRLIERMDEPDPPSTQRGLERRLAKVGDVAAA